ncbi:MAG: hypothetical protein PHG05_03315 [Candidatus Nanoarchaeia archaeon]|nr:hypothetical protein [Candidatus Nanoarchaeia archaeon]
MLDLHKGPKTFLFYFKSTNSPFAIIENRLHTLETKSDSKNVLYLGTKRLFLEQSEELEKLEQEFLEKNRNYLETYVSDELDKKYLSHLKRSTILMDNLKRSIINPSGDIESFLMIDVLNAYYSRDFNINNISNNFKLDGVSLRLEDLKPNKSILGEIAGNSLFIDNNYYSLETSNEGSPDKLFFGNYKFVPRLKGRYDEIENKYLLRLKELIDKKINNVAENLEGILINQKETLDGLEKLADMQNSYRQGGSARIKDIGFEKTSIEGVYGIFLYVNSFIMKKNGKYYAFDKVKVGTAIENLGRSFRIIAIPQVLGEGKYVHPFVSLNGKYICFDSKFMSKEEVWARVGVYFNKEYDFVNEKRRSAKILSNVLKKCELGLTNGYNNGANTPFRYLEELVPIAINEADAKRYAINHGISEWRIFDNDRN